MKKRKNNFLEQLIEKEEAMPEPEHVFLLSAATGLSETQLAAQDRAQGGSPAPLRVTLRIAPPAGSNAAVQSQ